MIKREKDGERKIAMKEDKEKGSRQDYMHRERLTTIKTATDRQRKEV